MPGTDDAAEAMYRFLEFRTGRYMTRKVEVVTRKMTMRQLQELFEKHDFNSFPVVEDGMVVGIVDDEDERGGACAHAWRDCPGGWENPRIAPCSSNRVLPQA